MAKSKSKCELICGFPVPNHQYTRAELSTTDTAGLRFVVSTPAHSLDKHDHKAIRSHATRGVHLARRQSAQLSSWISPDRALGSLKKAIPEEALILGSIILVPSPRRVGSDLSGLQLPSGVEPYMVQELVKCMHTLTCSQSER
jgi:hypothetical protein